MTRLNLRDLIRKRLGETTAAFWTDVELNQWINDAGHDIAFKTKCLRTNSKMTTTESEDEYVLSTEFTDAISFFEVYMYEGGSNWVKMKPTDRTQLDLDTPGWKDADDGTPTKYWWDREEDIFAIWVPPDSDNAGTDYIHAYYALDFTDMTTDVAPSLPSAVHAAMVDYVVATGFETRGWGDKSNNAWTQYAGRLRGYMIERHREREDDEIIMRNYKNI